MSSPLNQVEPFQILLTAGVYMEGIAGVRLEDVVLVTSDGPELLGGMRAKDWMSP